MKGLKHGLPTDVPQIASTLADCTTDVIAWCAAKRLQLNADKTEVMWFGSAANLSKIPLALPTEAFASAPSTSNR